jgi:hypothetical protein
MSYEILMNFSQFYYMPLTYVSYPYFKLLTNFIRTSYKHFAKFLSTSYDLVTIFYTLFEL